MSVDGETSIALHVGATARLAASLDIFLLHLFSFSVTVSPVGVTEALKRFQQPLREESTLFSIFSISVSRRMSSFSSILISCL